MEPSSVLRPPARKSVFVCLAAVGIVAAASSLARAEDRAGDGSATVEANAPKVLRAEGGAEVLAFPPRASAGTTAEGRRVVYLHGMHGLARNGCPVFERGAGEIGWLLCPEANARLKNGTYSWAGTAEDKLAIIERAKKAAEPLAGRERATDGDVLVGFSQGSYVSIQLVNARLGRHVGLVLLAADVAPDVQAMRDVGVRRVVLAAGALDATYAPMRRTARRLSSEPGLEVRFVGLGRVGHTYVAADEAHAKALRDAIVWAGGAPPARSPEAPPDPA
jgi:predicted esterase